jgi:hypothetical protein
VAADWRHGGEGLHQLQQAFGAGHRDGIQQKPTLHYTILPFIGSMTS